MATKPLSKQIKQGLIQHSIKRKLKQTESGKPLNLPISAINSDYDTSFENHPGYRQLKIMREGAKQLDAPDPFFRVHDGVACATTSIGNKEYINFASYNYLGLSGHHDINQAAKQAIDDYGTSVSASRVVSGERHIHQQLETEIAQLYGVDSALVFVSGHATNVTTIGYLMDSKDLIIHDEYIHNSSLVGAKLAGARRISFPHNDFAFLEKLLNEHRDNYQRVLIIVEGLYSMDGDAPDLKRLVNIKKRYGAWLMVDEAHSLGVLGKTGRGLSEHCHVDAHEVDIWMGTLSKTLSGCGGFIAGSQALCDMLRYFCPGFLYSVGIPPQVAAPALASLKMMQKESERIQKLHSISQYFLTKLQGRAFTTGTSIGIAIVPVILGSSLKAAKFSEYMFEHGVNVQPILYPAVPEKSARLRFFLSSEHTKDQIDYTVDKLSNFII
jgi:8-amino-7-oxononanoate synthase